MALQQDFNVKRGIVTGTSASITGNTAIGGNLAVTGTTLFSNNVVVAGNLTITGTTTYVNTATLNVSDNIVTLNADWPASAPTESAGIEVNRGTSANVQLLWDETSDYWKASNNTGGFAQLHLGGTGATSVSVSNANTDFLQSISLTIDQFGHVNGATTSSANIASKLDGRYLGFQTLAVSGQTSVVADSYNDTLTFATSGGGMSITTDASTDTVTFGVGVANTSVAGVVTLVDSVANTSTSTYAPTLAAVKNAYDRAIDANTRASSAQTAAVAAYTNATSYAATIAATAYSNATSYAASIAATAYSNATSYAASIAATAYSNAVSTAAAGRSYPKRSDGGDLNFYWSGQSGQPTWLWGGSDGNNMYVYNPSNFSVSSAVTANTSTYLSATQQVNVITGKTQSLVMSTADTTNNGSFVCRASGTGDSNLAGLAFYNDSYALKMGLRADGYIGIGGWSRAAWSWYSDNSGNMVAAGNVTAYSDPRLKEKFTKISNALDMVDQLDGGTFYWKEGIEHTAVKAGKRDYGVLADQVEKIMPEIVTDSIELDGVSYKTVSYEKIVPVLIEAIKDLNKQVKELKGQLENGN